MDPRVKAVLDDVMSTADFGYVEFSDINDTNAFGANALHCVCVWGDLEAAKVLVEAGINVNQPGEFGETPYSIAWWRGHRDLANYLVENGADPHGSGKATFHPEQNAQHMAKLSEGIKRLEKKIEEQCGGGGA